MVETAQLGYIWVSDTPFPYPDYESGMQTQSTTVNGGRNAMNQFIGQQVGRVQAKIEMQWTKLDASLWASMLRMFDPDYGGNFVNPVRYYDMTAAQMITRNMYVSDRSATPYSVDPDTGIWLLARNCKLNLIEA